jgi:hypothetical protein
MTTDMIVDLDKATTYAEDLPDHTGQLSRYTAAGLAEKVAWSLEARAAKIISIGRRGILEMGQELLAAREEASHGTWTAFLARCGIEERTARNYMSVAERFGDKPEIISDLSPTSLYALAAPSADPIVVQEIITEMKRGAPAPTVAQVKERLAPAPPPADGAPHLPPDFAAAQAQAKKLGLYLSMGASGRFTLIYESTRAVAGTAETWPQALAILTERERQAAAPAPTQATLLGGDDQEIAAAAPAPPPPTIALTPLPPALPGLASMSIGVDARKLLVSKRMLLQAALHLIEDELARTTGPLISFPAERALEAARLFVANPALGGAAAMLAFSAVVEQEEIVA